MDKRLSKLHAVILGAVKQAQQIEEWRKGVPRPVVEGIANFLSDSGRGVVNFMIARSPMFETDHLIRVSVQDIPKIDDCPGDDPGELPGMWLTVALRQFEAGQEIDLSDRGLDGLPSKDLPDDQGNSPRKNGEPSRFLAPQSPRAKVLATLMAVEDLMRHQPPARLVTHVFLLVYGSQKKLREGRLEMIRRELLLKIEREGGDPVFKVTAHGRRLVASAGAISFLNYSEITELVFNPQRWDGKNHADH